MRRDRVCDKCNPKCAICNNTRECVRCKGQFVDGPNCECIPGSDPIEGSNSCKKLVAPSEKILVSGNKENDKCIVINRVIKESDIE